jgi:DNA-binding ferritin-like protein
VAGSSVKLEGSPTRVQRRIVYDIAGKSFKAVEEGAGMVSSENNLVESLIVVLLNTFAFYAQAHTAHWNVVSSDFKEWHDLFGEIYDDAWGAVDPLAENIRKLKASVPSNLVQMSQGEEVVDPSTDPRALAVDLLVANEKLIDLIKAAFDVATADKEQGIANFLADRQDVHSKWGWQLRASLGLKSVSQKGGAGSGNFGHSGRPGERGGSGEGGGSDSDKKIDKLTASADKAAERASKASDRAFATEDPEDHLLAAEAHGTALAKVNAAADAMEAAGDKAGARTYRSGLGKHHESRMATHERRAETLEQRGEEEEEDGEEKSFSPEIKVVQPAPSIKVLFTPPSSEQIAKGISEAVEKALSKRTGKLL